MRFSLALVTLLAAPVAAEPKLAGNVLVWIDAPLCLDATDGGPSIHLGQLEHGREHAVNFVVPMHVVATQGDFVEVEPTSDIDCAWSRVVRRAGVASLRLYVKRTDLAPVVAKAFTAAFKDGSRIALQSGVAVKDGKVDVKKPTGARACGNFVVARDEPMPEAPHPDETSRPDRTLQLCAPAADVKVEQRSRF